MAENNPQNGVPTYSTQLNYPAVRMPEAYRKELDAKESRKNAILRAAESIPLWLLAPAALVLGMLYSSMILRHAVGVGLPVITALFYALVMPLAFRKDRTRAAQMLLTGVPMALLTLSFAFNSSLHGRFLMMLAQTALFMLNLTVMCGCTDARHILSITAFGDTAYNAAAAPIVSLAPAYAGLFSRKKKDENGGTRLAGGVGRIVIGLVIAVPVVIILLVSLASADAAFGGIVDKMENFIESLNIELGDFAFDLIFGAAIGLLYIMPLTASLKAGAKRYSADKPASRWLDPVIAATVAYACALVFAVFVAVQLKYFFPASIGYYFSRDFSSPLTLPDNMTWAEYARSGFFELSGVIICSAVAILLIMAFCRRSEKTGAIPGYLRAALTVIAGCNLVMTVSAVLRMVLYTTWCGLTAMRIGVLMIIAVMAISLICTIVRLWSEKFPLVRVVCTAAICAAVCFGCMNVDRVCAEVNVSRHLGSGTSIDMSYLGTLSCGAAPAVKRLAEESPDEDIRAAARGLLAVYYYHGYGSDWNDGVCDYDGRYGVGSVTLDRLTAARICRSMELKKEMTEDYYNYSIWSDEKREYEMRNDDEFMSYDEYCERYF